MRVTDPVVNQFLEPDHEFDFNPVNRNLCFGGGKKKSPIEAPTIEAPSVDLPEIDVPTPPPVPSPNLDQDLTKGSTGAIQEAAIKAGSDVQDTAIKTGSDVQAGVTDITSQTGVKNETVEKIIESNVKGTESSISSNVKGTESQAEDITKAVEEIGTILTEPFQKETTPTDEPADTTVSPEEDTSSNPPPGPGEVLTDEMTAQERKSRNRLLQASRYGRQRTILTGGSGISGYGY